MSDKFNVFRGTYIPQSVVGQLTTFNSELERGRILCYMRGTLSAVCVRRYAGNNISVTTLSGTPEDVADKSYGEAKKLIEEGSIDLTGLTEDNEILLDVRSKLPITIPDSYIKFVSFVATPLFIVEVPGAEGPKYLGPFTINMSSPEHIALFKAMATATYTLHPPQENGTWSDVGKMLATMATANEHNHKIDQTEWQITTLAKRRNWFPNTEKPLQLEEKKLLSLLEVAQVVSFPSARDSKKVKQKEDKEMILACLGDILQVGLDNYLATLNAKIDLVEVDDEGLLTAFKNKYKVGKIHIWGGMFNVSHRYGPEPFPKEAMEELSELLDSDRISYIDLNQLV